MSDIKAFILKKDLPSIKAGRVIQLSEDGVVGQLYYAGNVIYAFSIDVLKNEKDWFEEYNYNTNDTILPCN